MKLPLRQKDIKWSGIVGDDMTGRITFKGDNYMLRIEEMDIDKFWVCIYKGSEVLWDNNSMFVTGYTGAKRIIMKQINKHFKDNS